MKTFEDMKHNIPDGATHYFEETENEKFAWWNESKSLLLCPDNNGQWEAPGVHDDVSNPTPIPQTKEVEWEVLHGETWHPCVRFGNDIYGNYAYQISDGEFKGEFNGATQESCFRKPETEVERVERERLEAAYDLYTHVQSVRGQLSCKFDWFSNSEMEETRLRFLAIVDKTNYRKEG